MHLSAHGDELWIDLDRTALQIPLAPPLRSRGRADSVVVRVFSPGGLHTRIMVEVTGKSDYAIVQRASEIVLRLAPAGQVANLRGPFDHEASIMRRRPTPSSGGDSPCAARVASVVISPRRQSALSRSGDAEIPLVMIDPGHGGYDPGTQSAGGILEKDVALSISRRSRHAL